MTINKQALLIENGQLVADTLRHLADNEIDSDYFAITSTSENGTETEYELAITDYALQAAGTVDELVKALDSAEKQNAMDVQIKARLCRESNSLHDRLREVEKLNDELNKRNAELVAKIEPMDRRIAELREWNAGLAQESCEQQQRIAEQSDYFSSFVTMARTSADKAMRKFPQPNYVLLKVAEEAGEVVQAGVHYAENRMTWDEVEGEIVQLLAMLIRLVTEGDQINGVTPPQVVRTAGISKGE